jgi:hypothetical protein
MNARRARRLVRTKIAKIPFISTFTPTKWRVIVARAAKIRLLLSAERGRGGNYYVTPSSICGVSKVKKIKGSTNGILSIPLASSD